MKNVLGTLTVATVLLFAVSAMAQTKVVVVPLGGSVGDAVAADVVKGKTFSSKAGKGLTGTLEQHPMGQTYTNSNGMTFNLIPAGTFTMGSPDGTGADPAEPGRYANETQHVVTLTESFYMQATEVTQKQWQDVIGNNPAGSNTGDNYPIETVNWFEAAYFANALSISEGRSECYTLTGCSPIPAGNGMECTGVSNNAGCTGYRLPTEAQWEYAARAGTTTAYANPVSFDATNVETGSGFNSNLHAMGWYLYNNTMTGYNSLAAHPSGTKPVAQKQANLWGLYDMHGNVYEWCQDWWDGGAYSSDPVTDPTGDSTGSGRVFRGGGWYDYAWCARSAFRFNYTPGGRSGYLGFRLALPPGQ
ncbi:MAG: formylglycine-generating enzyme family protein [Desulfobulbaceae bacterium]|nr:formylglycine-generating enzyme family protein [Desulfobulbaceae bacterium]